MSRVAKLFFVTVVIALVFSAGCKDKNPYDAPDAPDDPGASVGSVEKEKPVVAEHDIWMTDYQAAMKKASAENKDLLIDFTGSDWCDWCISLDKEVFSHKEFIDEASKDFVFVMVDFPKKKLAPELKAQNDRLGKKYGIRGYPTIYLTDSKGEPYAQTGYRKGGPEKYLVHLAELREKK
ncbi:MAG: thioredoxin family protein [Planctomycetes bacterium]|nr:thioredoxin family protein [Planctomycetota bacterium]